MAHSDNNRTFDVEYGLGPNGSDHPKLFSGTENPNFVANEGSVYLQNNGNLWKYKVPPEVPVAIWAKESIGDITEAEGFTDLPQETSTANGWVSKNNYPFLTSNTKTTGTFSIRWSIVAGQTKAGKNFGYRVRWRVEGGTWASLLEIDQASINSANDVFLQGGFSEVVLLADNKIEVDVQYGQTTAGGAAIIREASVEVRRIGD